MTRLVPVDPGLRLVRNAFRPVSDRVGMPRDTMKAGLGGSVAQASTSQLGDAEIRHALRAYLRARYADKPGTAILDELAICRGQVRVDLAVVNGSVHGYEIKSDRDTLD